LRATGRLVEFDLRGEIEHEEVEIYGRADHRFLKQAESGVEEPSDAVITERAIRFLA